MLHRLLHSAALYDAARDQITQQLLHQTYADTLHRCFEAAVESIAAGAAARVLTEVAGQSCPQIQLPEVQLSPEQALAAWQFMDGYRKHAEHGKTATSGAYLGAAQKRTADALYAAQYPNDSPTAGIE